MAVGITIRAVAIMRIISQISTGCTREQATAEMVTAVRVRRPIGLIGPGLRSCDYEVLENSCRRLG